MSDRRPSARTAPATTIPVPRHHATDRHAAAQVPLGRRNSSTRPPRRGRWSAADPDCAPISRGLCCYGNSHLPWFATLRVQVGVCGSSLLSGRNARWPCRVLPFVSHGEYADGIDRRTDGRQTVTLPFPPVFESMLFYVFLKIGLSKTAFCHMRRYGY